MLAQLLKNLYICTFLFVLRQKQEVVTQTARGGTQGGKKKRGGGPSQPTSHSNKPIPAPQKVKTAMQAPPIQRSDERVEKENNINIRVPHSPLRTEMTGIKADINTSFHIISIRFLAPQPIGRFSSVQTGWWGRVSGYLSFTYIY